MCRGGPPTTLLPLRTRFGGSFTGDKATFWRASAILLYKPLRSQEEENPTMLEGFVSHGNRASKMDDRDFGLRRLFRPPLDSLSAEQQLPYYKVRDLVPSHSFRSDTSHVGFPVVRKRIIDSVNYAGPRDDQGD